MLIRDYLNEDEEKKMVNYKYKGADYSILYKYVLSPMAEWVLNTFIPLSLAPNVITMISFACTVIPHIIIGFYVNWGVTGYVPAWLCIITGVLKSLYSTLDNCDGKQARRTKSSSPLGTLFDHGCDAMNVTITYISVATVLQFDASATAIIGYLVGIAPFCTALWEQFFLDGLYLPIINGASEGSYLVVFLFIFSGIKGVSFWKEESLIPSVRNNQIILFGCVLLAILSVSSNFQNVYKKLKKDFNKTYIYLAPAALIIVTYGLLLLQDEELLKHYRLMTYMIGLNVTKYTLHLQLDHITQRKEPSVFRKSTIAILTTMFVNHFVRVLPR
eukprot:TRINITY_DN7360_c0_g2_i2.p1 TRINITY_DN7360_c0_g2~~TRINITY_DN7360_c0_g2_i2.p1  ORF type:complete len:330 (-),score=64.58 TRINITY_DN7360_c0_g2_i2:333-1322(-)